MKPRGWIYRPVHHVLIAAYPILYLVSINLGEVEPVEALVPLAVSVGASMALFLVLVVVGVPARRAALLVSIVAVVVLFFGLGSAAAASLGVTGTPMLVAWLLLGAGLVAVVVVSRTDLRGITIVLNAGSAILVAITLVGIGGHLLSEPATSGVRQPSDGEASPSPNPSAATGARPRDIYYFILDAYGAPRALNQYLDVPDDGFMDWLEGAGFEVLRETRSNYARTPLSLASSMNMTYLDELAAERGPDDPSHRPLVQMVRTAEAIHFLKDRGYSYVLLGSQYYLTPRSPLADVNPVFEQTSDFIGVLTQSTILPPLVSLMGVKDDLTVRRTIYDAAIWGLETFPELADLPGPKFVFMHLYLPHSPWVVDGDGDYVTAEEDDARPPTERYRTQYAFVDREIQELIAGLLDVPEEEQPIIILTPDHGPNTPGMREVEGDIDWEGASDAELDLKFAIFTAYHLPGVDDTCLYQGMSSVNQFRLVFDLYFDAGLPLLPDRSYIHRNRSHPYDLTDVTDRLPASGTGSDTETSCDI
jgi:hypothetical protein